MVSSPRSGASLKLVVDFSEHVKATSLLGTNGHNEQCKYFPPSKQKKYWTPTKIKKLIHAHYEYVPSEIINKEYLGVFSTLVFADRVASLSQFSIHGLTDAHFPLYKYPERWQDVPALRELFKAFQEHQWMFFPFVFRANQLSDSIINPRQILPLAEREALSNTQDACVAKIVINNACHSIDPAPGSVHNDTFVIKTYRGDRGKRLYENERRAFVALQDNPSKHVIKCYGSFRQLKTYNLVLEYVSGGSLLEFYKDIPPPRCPQAIHDFWTSFQGLFEGLHHIHQITEHHQDAPTYRMIHQDLKPANILLVMEDKKNPYKFCVKIADFGYSHVRIVEAGEEDKQGRDRQGSQMYSAPENSHHERYLEEGRHGITAAADIWACGCITSDAAVWVVWGSKGREEYLKMRTEETQKISNFKDSGYEGCYHNGVSCLRAVRETHAKLIKELPSESLTTRIIRHVEPDMLERNPHSRLQASQVKNQFVQVLSGYDKDNMAGIQLFMPESTTSLSNGRTLSRRQHRPSDSSTNFGYSTENSTTEPFSSSTSPPSSPFVLPNIVSSPTQLTPGLGLDLPVVNHRRSSSIRSRASSFLERFTGSPSHSHSPTSPYLTGNPSLSLQDVLKFRDDKKQNWPPDQRVQDIIDMLVKNIGNRDHIFFIDDSPTMSEHAAIVLNTFIGLSYLAKQIDSDGIELFFASSPRVRSKSHHTSELIRKLKTHRYSASPTLMENLFSEFLNDRVYNPLLSFQKPVSILVITDGRWGSDLERGGGVENPIQRLIRRMKALKLNRNQVMIQFICFGDDQDAQRYMAYLDDELGREEKCDIVDARSFDDDVYNMFIGSLSQAIDGNNRRDVISTGLG
ncbi:kinase-like protein [Xylariaceae sp. AK1471]|nr:kinase-like protein [Xylariaceae sp. AK1471]